MLLKRTAKAISKILQWKRPLRKSLQEAADQQRGKQTKVETFGQFTAAEDLRQIGQDDREAVKNFRARKGSYQVSGKPHNNDAILCDDMTIDSGGGNLAEILLCLIIGGAAVWWLTAGDAPQQPPAVPDTEYEVLFFDQHGQPIEVKPLPQNLTPKGE